MRNTPEYYTNIINARWQWILNCLFIILTDMIAKIEIQ